MNSCFMQLVEVFEGAKSIVQRVYSYRYDFVGGINYYFNGKMLLHAVTILTYERNKNNR